MSILSQTCYLVIVVIILILLELVYHQPLFELNQSSLPKLQAYSNSFTIALSYWAAKIGNLSGATVVGISFFLVKRSTCFTILMNVCTATYFNNVFKIIYHDGRPYL